MDKKMEMPVLIDIDPSVELSSQPLVIFKADDEFLTIKEGAIFMKMSNSNLEKLVHRKEIVFHQNKPGGRVRFLKSDLVQFIISGRVELQKMAEKAAVNRFKEHQRSRSISN